MNRKTKILISISGITIVALMMLAFTYGYFITRIDGNTNTKSVHITTGESSLVYTDLTEEDVTGIIEPGYETIKYFTVQNTGNIRAVYSIYLTDVINEFTRTQDITYVLYRSTLNGNIDDTTIETCISDNTCVEVTDGIFPTKAALIQANEAIENTNDIYTYALKITYANSSEDQSEDMGKTFSGTVQIYGSDNINNVNPYSEGTLANAIIENAKTGGANRTVYTLPTDLPTTIGSEINTEDERILSYTTDDYGDSYYFRGNVKDNYLNFNEMCWRIVRIQGDGSIRLLLASDKECSTTNLTDDSGFIKSYATSNDRTTEATLINVHYGYNDAIGGSASIPDYVNSKTENATSMRTNLNTWLSTHFDATDLNSMKKDNWCIGDMTNAYKENWDGVLEIQGNAYELLPQYSFFWYSGMFRVVNVKPSLVCDATGADGEVDNNYIGTLTIDEIVYAGAGFDLESEDVIPNENYYIYDNVLTKCYYTLTLSEFSIPNVSSLSVNGSSISEDSIDSSIEGFGTRAMITLKSGVKINGGNGTVDSPYTIINE